MSPNGLANKAIMSHYEQIFERGNNMKEFFTDEQVDNEIERLLKSPAVQLSKAEQRVRYRRRQYMYQLRWHEKRGKELAAQGLTLESLEFLDVDERDTQE